MKQPVKVSAAIIIKNRKILIAKRKPCEAGGQYWEFPGGKIEPGESPVQALVREVKEECNIEIKNHFFFEETLYQYQDKTVHLFFYVVRSFIGHIQSLVHADLVWVKVEQLGQYQFLPADQQVLKRIRKQF